MEVEVGQSGVLGLREYPDKNYLCLQISKYVTLNPEESSEMMIHNDVDLRYLRNMYLILDHQLRLWSDQSREY